MAKKLKLMGLFQELNGRAQVTNRRPAPSASGMYLMQLRAQAGAMTLPRRRFMISVDLSKTQPLPHPVKINHIRGTETAPTATDPGAQPTAMEAASRPGEVPQVRSKVG